MGRYAVWVLFVVIVVVLLASHDAGMRRIEQPGEGGRGRDA